MTPFNTAQRLLLALGFDPMQLLQHLKDKSFSHRKSGPGRKHKQGRMPKEA